jgi:hypothetical protein
MAFGSLHAAALEIGELHIRTYFLQILIMSLVLSAATMDDNRRPELLSSPNSYPTNVYRRTRHTEELIGHAGILGSDNGKKKEEGVARFASDTSGIVSHLRASSSSHDNTKETHSLMNNSLAQTMRAMTSYNTASSMLPRLDRYSSLLFSSNASAIAQAFANRPGFPMMSSAMLHQTPPLSRVSGFSMANHPFGQDPRFMSRLVSSCFIPPAPASRREPVILFMECDEDSLSEYQCLIRKQIELFEADKEEAASSVQGRNKQVVEGQVGIRCRHCTVADPRQRQKGCMYFPTKLDRIYQAAQNLSAFHLCEHCKHVPAVVRQKILVLRERKSPAGGGKRYWAEGVRCQGVFEDRVGLRFQKS